MSLMLSKVVSLLTVGFLITVFLLVGNKRPASYIKSFRLQSLLLAVLIGVISINRMVAEKQFEPMLIICVLTFVLKVVIIPNMLKNLREKVTYIVEKDFYFNIPLLEITCAFIYVMSWYAATFISVLDNFDQRLYFSTAVASLLMGLFFMITRKKAIGQIVGLLTIENGIILGAILLTFGMPMIVELGIFFDLLTAVIIMGSFVFKISDTFEHIDMNKLTKLKG
ncbi:MAG: hydrogenase [Eubacteriales bacterium]